MKIDILVKELEYPRTLGEGNEISKSDPTIKNNGCAVITELIKEGKLKEGFDWGNEDDFSVLKIISGLDKEQLQMCESSILCGEIIKKVKNNQYKYCTKDEKDNICVLRNEQKYIPIEGKHRACIVKNFMDEDDIISVNLEK